MQEEMKEFAGLERELAALRPVPPANRDAVMFEAGRAAAGRSARLWQMSSAAMLLLVLGMGGLLWRGNSAATNTANGVIHQPLPRVVPPDVAPGGEVALTEEPANVRFPPGSYLWLRNEILSRGVGALPRPVGGDSSPQTPRTDDLQGTPSWQRRAVL